MTRDEQRKFTEGMTETIKVQVMRKIESGDVPTNWDGGELRQYIADIAAHEARYLEGAKKRAYNNDIQVNNL